jgi:hypothetical protein
MNIDPLRSSNLVQPIRELSSLPAAPVQPGAAASDGAEFSSGPGVGVLRSVGTELRNASADYTQKSAHRDALERAFKYVADIGNMPKIDAPARLSRTFTSLRDSLGRLDAAGPSPVDPNGAVAAMMNAGPLGAADKAGAAADEIQAKLDDIRSGMDAARERLTRSQVAFENVAATAVGTKDIEEAFRTAPQTESETTKVPLPQQLASVIGRMDITPAAAGQLLQ